MRKKKRKGGGDGVAVKTGEKCARPGGGSRQEGRREEVRPGKRRYRARVGGGGKRYVSKKWTKVNSNVFSKNRRGVFAAVKNDADFLGREKKARYGKIKKTGVEDQIGGSRGGAQGGG